MPAIRAHGALLQVDRCIATPAKPSFRTTTPHHRPLHHLHTASDIRRLSQYPQKANNNA
ncbi:hypothetical protein D3C76_424800 [compost metagenome]